MVWFGTRTDFSLLITKPGTPADTLRLPHDRGPSPWTPPKSKCRQCRPQDACPSLEEGLRLASEFGEYPRADDRPNGRHAK